MARDDTVKDVHVRQASRLSRSSEAIPIKGAGFRPLCTGEPPVPRDSYSVCLPQSFLHPRPTLPRRLLFGSRSAPMGLKTHRKLISISFQRLELAGPIHDAGSNWRPVVLFPVL